MRGTYCVTNQLNGILMCVLFRWLGDGLIRTLNSYNDLIVIARKRISYEVNDFYIIIKENTFFLLIII